MRAVARDRQHEVVMVDVHLLDACAHALPEPFQSIERIWTGVRVGQKDAPAILEEFRETGAGSRMLGPGQRVTGNEVHALRHMGRNGVDHGPLDRTDIGEGGARLEMRFDFTRHGPHRSDRHGKNDKVCIFHRRRGRIGDNVTESEFARSFAAFN